LGKKLGRVILAGFQGELDNLPELKGFRFDSGALRFTSCTLTSPELEFVQVIKLLRES